MVAVHIFNPPSDGCVNMEQAVIYERQMESTAGNCGCKLAVPGLKVNGLALLD
jgi:hypothetical protein